MSLTKEQKRLLPHIANVTELKKEYPLMENEGLYAIGMATLDAGKCLSKIMDKWQIKLLASLPEKGLVIQTDRKAGKKTLYKMLDKWQRSKK